MKFQAPRGTSDILPAESHRWVRLENTFREVMGLYGYAELRTPTFEDTALFTRTAGETSDIVSKQMYEFTDKGGRSMTLKPEGTAPAMRALIEHKLLQPGIATRVFYITPVFRYERPQMGRLREPHQVGFELIGSGTAAADAEVIEITVRFYERLGLENITVLLNSLGQSSCRTTYRAALLEYAASYIETQEQEVKDKILRNPLRLLDSKDPGAIEALKGAPKITDFLEPESQTRFEELQRLLTLAQVPFQISPEIVRGLDYYSETVFEVHSTKLGAQGALCGGGRYDGLISELGGPNMPSVGVGMGIERALIVLGEDDPSPSPKVFIVEATPSAGDTALTIGHQLRQAGISVVRELDGRTMKAQMKTADRLGVSFVLLLGEDELSNGIVSVKSMSTGEQVSIKPGSELVAYLTDRL